jgi:hypothetical protein
MSLELGLVYFIGRITLDDFAAATVHILSKERKREEKKRKEKRKGRSNFAKEANGDKKAFASSWPKIYRNNLDTIYVIVFTVKTFRCKLNLSGL